MFCKELTLHNCSSFYIYCSLFQSSIWSILVNMSCSLHDECVFWCCCWIAFSIIISYVRLAESIVFYILTVNFWLPCSVNYWSWNLNHVFGFFCLSFSCVSFGFIYFWSFVIKCIQLVCYIFLTSWPLYCEITLFISGNIPVFRSLHCLILILSCFIMIIGMSISFSVLLSYLYLYIHNGFLISSI